MFEKIRFNENRNLAWSVFTVVVVLAILLSGGGALRQKKDEVLAVYTLGANGDGLCIASDMLAREQSAYNLASTANRYDEADDTLVQAVFSAGDALSALAETDVSAVSEANIALTRAVENLYTEIDDITMSENDAQYALTQYKEFTSRALTISRDAYNTRAEEFNSLIKAFPASIVARIAQIGELALFR